MFSIAIRIWKQETIFEVLLKFLDFQFWILYLTVYIWTVASGIRWRQLSGSATPRSRDRLLEKGGVKGLTADISYAIQTNLYDS